MNELDRLLGILRAAAGTPGAGDAIDAERARPPRTTAAVDLADDPAVIAFRNELIDGLIRADTARKVLDLIGLALQQILR